MFRIKICGITSLADAQCVARSGADAVGLNFYAGSPRCIDPARAAEISAVLPNSIARVGVFVNAAAGDVREIAQRLELDYVQLHGDEPPEYLADLDGLPILRAFRAAADLTSLADYLAACRILGHLPAAILIDSHRPGQYGGTGEIADWSAVARAKSEWPDVPLVLAGGLKAENVAAAIEAVRPAAVDTASGVESAPGVKCPDRVGRFVTAAREAFEAADRRRSAHDPPR